MGIFELRKLKLEASIPKIKRQYSIPKKSAKRIEREKNEKGERGTEDTLMEQWFKARRKDLTGICQCGCGKPSQKKDDMYFRHSCCHLFPKSKFPSLMYHPLNYIERAFFGGCHSVLDDTSMDRWVGMADWDSIKEQFHLLAPLLTDEERATKFYSKFESLVYGTKNQLHI